MPKFLKRKKGNKYNNKTVEWNGLKFDSRKEMERYLFLLEAKEQGLIHTLQRQVKFELIPAVKETYIEHLKTKDKEKVRTLQLAITYTCDFAYYKGDEYVIEDVKASPKMLPKEYTLKKKMMFALKGIKIKEIYKPNETI